MHQSLYEVAGNADLAGWVLLKDVASTLLKAIKLIRQAGSARHPTPRRSSVSMSPKCTSSCGARPVRKWSLATACFVRKRRRTAVGLEAVSRKGPQRVCTNAREPAAATGIRSRATDRNGGSGPGICIASGQPPARPAGDLRCVGPAQCRQNSRTHEGTALCKVAASSQRPRRSHRNAEEPMAGRTDPGQRI